MITFVTKKCHQLYFFILASTSTLKLPLSPRPNLMPFPSRETASATKCHQQLWCHQLWPSPKRNHTLLSHLAGYAFWLLYCTFILATNCFKKLKQNFKLFFYLKTGWTKTRGWLSANWGRAKVDVPKVKVLRLLRVGGYFVRKLPVWL